MLERLKEIAHYRRNIKALPKGNSLCYKGERDGHGQTSPIDIIRSYPEGIDTEIVLFEPNKPPIDKIKP